MLFLHNSHTVHPNLRSSFCNHRRLERFQKILCISKLFGSRGGGIEILTLIGVQKCQFLAKSENWTYVYDCCSCKLIMNDECLVYIHSLDFPRNTHITKIEQLHFSLIWSATGPILPFVVLLLLYLHPHSKLKINYMTVDIHVSRSKNLVLNGSRSTDVNTKYEQQQTNTLNLLHFLNSQ